MSTGGRTARRRSVDRAAALSRLRAAVVRPGELGTDELLARVAWSTVVEPGDGTAGELVGRLGAGRSIRAVLQALDDGPVALGEMLVEAGRDSAEDDVRDELARAASDALVPALERWRPRLLRLDVDAVLGAASAVGCTLLVPGDEDWPAGIDDLGVHAPLVLWRRGTRPVGGLPGISVVGARANTVLGAEAAAEITSAAADAGCLVVSGGAYGIDAVAHRVALAAGTPTVAVLAGGVDQLYPAGNSTMLRSVADHGALLAECPPGTRPSRWRFLARNRLIAALGSVSVIVEAGARSGALNTAHHAGQLGRPVFAVPGPYSSSASAGCHRLIADRRAEIVVHPAEPVDAALRTRSGDPTTDPAVPIAAARVDPEVLRAVDALSRRRAISLDEVAVRSGLSPADATDALALAELQGLVTRGPGGWTAA
ncbi:MULTISPECIES: DNA-processing protein DprA [unclassified Curtobacterium]|uniref:DNA-processing protein DprA n=1 Tax=unclassified Curtobacterium TaxID=257496 RepID=UPI000D930CBF|nr:MULTISPECIES: DNA-processing protein DprA [unclassified Curtobacterium]PYY37067.1 DNA-protecting protein DprA [Curtobacterium sp. MCPF17_046]WIB14404.1 DNA-processing protein DprA [Curtobacterium sp. MCPF17_050]